MKQYAFVEPKETREEMVRVLVKGLGRALTDQEANTIFWLSQCGYESRGVLTDLFRELVERQD
jgi:hypothetical protein